MKKKNEFCIEDETTIILVESKRFGNQGILIDTEDYEKVKNYRWYIVKNGNCFYAKTNILEKEKRKGEFMHRLIKECPNNKVIDHKNGNGLDNRKRNLKICTQRINIQNQKLSTNNTSGYRNIFYNKNNKTYDVQIKHKRLGCYKTIEEAIKARNQYLIANCLEQLLLLYDRY